MGMSLTEATSLLLSGNNLAWNKYKSHKSGSITLHDPAQRRLFEFLLANDSSKVASGDESLFANLIVAWENADYDPAKGQAEAGGKANTESWRLDRIETAGFGGLTIFGGKPFDLYIVGPEQRSSH